MAPTPRRLAAALLVASTPLLAGCLGPPATGPAEPAFTASPATPRDPAPPADSPSPSPATSPFTQGERIDCGGAETRISEPGTQFRVTGTCPLVTIEGADIEVVFVDAIAEDVIIRGDRIIVTTGDIGTLSISGQDNVTDAAGSSAVQIRGDRNLVQIAGGLGALTIGGNDNNVTAGTVGAVAVHGSGNQVRPN